MPSTMPTISKVIAALMRLGLESVFSLLGSRLSKFSFPLTTNHLPSLAPGISNSA